MKNQKKNPVSKFSSAMGSLKGILDQEGIVNRYNNNITDVFIPTLSNNEYRHTDTKALSDVSAEEHISVVGDSTITPPVLSGTINVVDVQDHASLELDAYLADLNNEEFDQVDFHKSPAELEQTLAEFIEAEEADENQFSTTIDRLESVIESSIPQPETDSLTTDEKLSLSAHSHRPGHINISLDIIQQQLAEHIELSIEEFKSQLIASVNVKLAQLLDTSGN